MLTITKNSIFTDASVTYTGLLIITSLLLVTQNIQELFFVLLLIENYERGILHVFMYNYPEEFAEILGQKQH